MFSLRVRVILISFFVAFTLGASSVTDAEKAYRDQDYAAAEILYAKLLKSSPSNRVYNHRYGVCLYEQGKEYAIAEKHLLKSKKQGISLSYFYLGRVCFLQYKFDDALAYYKAYLQKSNDKVRKEQVNEFIPECEKGQLMFSRTEDVKIIDRIVVDREDFFTHYNLSVQAGTFLENAQEIDEDSIAENSTIYKTEKGNRVFFSQSEAGDTVDTGDIYFKNRLIDQWSPKTSLGSSVNTDSAEAFPFLMSDGVVLYFSSKGHDALGGYDIYVTRYNANLNAYLPPQQLGMPFNSPGDDILFTIDEYTNLGWFASDRDVEKGQIAIYTFEPNSSIKLLDTEDEELRRQSALLSNYDDYVVEQDTLSIDEVALVNAVTTTTIDDHLIHLVINDNLIYTSINDFMSDDAKALYSKYETLTADYEQASADLEAKRKLYSKASASEKKELIVDIIALEQQNAEAQGQQKKLLLQTRRIEQEVITKNGGYVRPAPQMVATPIIEAEVVEPVVEVEAQDLTGLVSEDAKDSLSIITEQLNVGVEYRIQFGVYSQALIDADAMVLPDLSYVMKDENLYCYFSGHYATPLDATMGLVEVKDKGFKDAYVVKFVNGEIEK